MGLYEFNHKPMFERIVLLLFCVIFSGITAYGQKFTPPPVICAHQTVTGSHTDSRSDEIDVLHYDIDLEIDKGNKEIAGFTELKIHVLKPIQSILLDLTSKLSVDSVLYNGKAASSFDQNGETLEVYFQPGLNTNDTIAVRVYYKGSPEQDPSWGGFYFTGDYAFNLGVGFVVDPHNFGRAWFPCVDDFTDRATYHYRIVTSANDVAQCNGLLVERNDLQNGKKEHIWSMGDPIPTYLSSVAVAPYTIDEYTYSGIPVTLAAVAADSSKMASSFENLPKCIDAYQASYGPHNFARIGFNLVPFNGGAMEHATNIAYPRFGAAGNKDYETLWAHEFAHHWWGNTVTCHDQSDMWINEGWASYSERIFLEAVYGRQAYRDAVEENHRHVLHYAHLADGGIFAVSGVDHDRTYGRTVYDKGADVAHTLRGYMGDSAFFKATAGFMKAYKFKDVSSEELRDHFQKYTSADLNAFFDQWVFQPGFPHFDVLGAVTSENGDKYEISLRIRQRTRFAPELYTHLPMEVTFYKANGDSATHQLLLSGKDSVYKVESDFVPDMIVLDRNELISDAITDDQLWVSAKGNYILQNGLMTVTVNEISDSALVRVEHNWVAPDRYFTHSDLPFLSKERYWRVDGLWDDEKFNASARITYNGRVNVGFSSGYLDNKLIQITEDSLVLLWRPRPDAYWEEYPDYQKIVGSPFDKYGTIIINNLKKGEYAFGMKDSQLLGVQEVEEKKDNALVTIQPIPSRDKIEIHVEKAGSGLMEVTNAKGEVVYQVEISSDQFDHKINVKDWAPGIYYLGVVKGNQPYTPKRFMVSH